MKRIFITSVLILACALIHAQHISEEDALAYASEFFQGRATSQLPNPTTGRKIARKAPRLKVAASRDEFYIFNDEANDGFVIVSAEAATPTILGYSYEGSYDETDVPEAMQAWLDSYAEQIRIVTDKPHLAAVDNQAMRESIEPLIKATWSQGNPYNLSCPKKNGNRCLTGCVFTAVAQIMHYYQYPSQVQKTIKADYSGFTDYQREIPAGTPLEWSKMLDSYKGTTTEAQQLAVANLMYYCGASCGAGYTGGETAGSPSIAAERLKEYFGYQGTMTSHQRFSTTYTSWQDMIYHELQHKRPVLMSGLSLSSGHSFICDGYDYDDFFHINWGWGGSRNGYFRLCILNYSSAQQEGVSMSDAYGSGQDIVIGIHPQASDDMVQPEVGIRGFYTLNNVTTYTRADASSDFTNFYARLWGSWTGCEDYSTLTNIEQAIGLFKNGTFLQAYPATNFSWGNYTTVPIRFGAGLALGNDYTFQPLWRYTGEASWRLSSSEYTLRADVTATQLTVNAEYRSTDDSSEGLTLVSIDDLVPMSQYTELQAVFRNDGQKPFRGDLGVYLDGKLESALCLSDIAPGATITMHIGFYSATAGSHKLTLEDVHGRQVASASIRVKGFDYQISAKAEPAEGGSVTISSDGTGWYASGESVKVTATANEGYEFLNWTEDMGQYSQVVSNSATYTFCAWANTTMIANFAPREEPITVTADSYSVTYGDEIPLLTYTVTGNGTLDGAPQLYCDAYKGCAAGTYPVRIERGTVTNRKVTFKSGKITVAKAPLTIGVEDATITLGNPLPTFRLTYDGFVNGDTEKIAFSTLPRARVNGGTPTEAGTYPIVVSGGVSDRYALTRVNGTLTVVAPDAIRSLLDSGTPFDVYNLLGKRLRTGTRSFKGLPSGIYIVNGQKVVVKSD